MPRKEEFWRKLMEEAAAKGLPELQLSPDRRRELRLAEWRLAASREPVDGSFTEATRAGALAHVVKQWGMVLAMTYRSVAVMAVSEALELASLKERRARLTSKEERTVSTVRRKYGREIVYARAMREAASLDPNLRRVATPRTVYLLAVVDGISTPPNDESELRAREKTWSSQSRFGSSRGRRQL